MAGMGLILPANAQDTMIGARTKDEIPLPEDLMREHGVLDRVLLIYEAGLHKFAANEDFDNPRAARWRAGGEGFHRGVPRAGRRERTIPALHRR